MKPHIASIFLAAFALAAQAAVVQRWNVETSRVQPVLFDAFHGESIDLQASLNSYGTPLDLTGKTATLFLQTNGMASAYWQTNAVTIASNTATAHFTGAMDTGAPTVRGFIGFAGENYRASFILRFRDSPGFAPAAIPLPTRELDFATTLVVHADEAPFVMKGGAGGVDAASVTNIAGQVATNVVPEWARAEDPPATGVTDVTTNGFSAVSDGVARIVFPAPPPTDRISNATHVITADRNVSWKDIESGLGKGTWTVDGVVLSWSEETGEQIGMWGGYSAGTYVGSWIQRDYTGNLTWRYREEGWHTGPDHADLSDGYVTQTKMVYGFYGDEKGYKTFTYTPVTKSHTTLLATTNEVCAVSNYVAALIAPLNPTFSNAVAVVVEYSANNAVTAAVDAQLTAILGGNWKTLYGGGLAGLIAALVAALTWLKTNKVGSFSAVGGQTPTVQNGVADLSTLFASGNTSLMGVCRYPIAAIEPVEGVYTAADSTVNTITPSAATTIYKPSETGKARDYIVTVAQGSTAYGVTFDGVFFKDFTNWPTMGANETYIFAFTEVATNSFMVAYKKVS